MIDRGPIRVLALDLHPRRFGYVVVESPDRLLDWGVRSQRVKNYSSRRFVQKRLRPLLDRWLPSVLILRKPKKTTSRGRPCSLFNHVVREAKYRRVQLGMPEKPIRRGKRLTKYENARRAAKRFAILRWRLPPKRRVWESENYRTSIFTAAILAMEELDITMSPSAAFLSLVSR